MKQLLICFFLLSSAAGTLTAQMVKTTTFSEMKNTVRPGFLSVKQKINMLPNNATYKNMTPVPNVPVINMGIDKMKSDQQEYTYVRAYLGDVSWYGAGFFRPEAQLEIGVQQKEAGTRLFELNVGVIKAGVNNFTVNIFHSELDDSKITKDPVMVIPVTISATDAKNWPSCPSKLIFAVQMLANKRYTLDIKSDIQYEFTNIQITSIK